MSIIKIQRLTLDNFKCHKHLKLDFLGRNAVLYGDNATGKTSIYDAFCWLLFGKDSQGQSDEKAFCIKPLAPDGEVLDHGAITSVKAELTVDEVPVSLERTFHEVWTTRRGSAESVYSGNTSEYFVNGVPCKKNEYERRIAEFINEDVFLLLTDLHYFPEKMKWQDRRAVLFEISGVYTDAEIMDTDSKFAPLKEAMGNLTIDDYGKKISSEKRGLTGIRDELPARMDELQRQIADMEALDFHAAEAEKLELEQEKERLSVSLLALKNDSAISEKRNEISSAQLELDRLEAENQAYRREQMQKQPDTDGIARSIAHIRQRISSCQNQIKSCNAKIDQYDRDIDQCLERWINTSAKQFSSKICPTCGQNLPEDKQKEAKNQFDVQKQDRLDEIVRTADKMKNARMDALERIEDLKSELSGLEDDAEKKEKMLADAKAETVVVLDIKDYAGIRENLLDRINSLKSECEHLVKSTEPEQEKLTKRIRVIEKEISEKMSIMARQQLITDGKARIEELRKNARETASRLESIASMQYLIEEYTRYKAGFVENSINSRFKRAKFRLFRNQANGGVEDRCDVTYNGVPYGSMNNGMKINVGVDIINTLSDCYGANVPLFVDNAESVTALDYSGAQIIKLVVSEDDKELRCEYEN